jgi:hypothetical protein
MRGAQGVDYDMSTPVTHVPELYLYKGGTDKTLAIREF